MSNKISKELYKQFLENMPIFCVDVIIEKNRKVLMVKRKNEPCKNQWWVPGGRLYKNERTIDAAVRKAREETSLDVEVVRQVGFYEVMKKEAQLGVKTGTHNPVVVYLLRPKPDQKISLDEQSSDYRWMDKIEDNMDDYLKQILKDSRIFD